MTTADLIAEEVKQLPEGLAVEVLDFVRFLHTRSARQQGTATVDAALDLLDHPPLNLGGRYLARAECHDRAGLR